MADADLVLWKGDVKSIQQNNHDSALIQSRFFLPSEILISRYGIVGMTIVDTKPRYRCVSYEDTEWTGVCGEKTAKEFAFDYGTPIDVVRQAHFVNTEQGFSILRVFVLPTELAEIFKSDEYLGEPVINKCVLQAAFDLEFDELKCRCDEQPLSEAMPVVETVALSGWIEAEIPDSQIEPFLQVRAWVSFHGWFAFREAVDQSQKALHRGLGTLDDFLEKMVPRAHAYAPSTSLVVASSNSSLEKT